VARPAEWLHLPCFFAFDRPASTLGCWARKHEPREAASKVELLSELSQMPLKTATTSRFQSISSLSTMLKLLIRARHGSGRRGMLAYLDGNTRDRQSEVDRFQPEGGQSRYSSSQTYKAGGTGLNPDRRAKTP
jgi:hypothetical protein